MLFIGLVVTTVIYLSDNSYFFEYTKNKQVFDGHVTSLWILPLMFIQPVPKLRIEYCIFRVRVFASDPTQILPSIKIIFILQL